jgi:S1 RNA binding domain protein
MKFETGAIVQGKVTGIVKFGAFVELAPGKSGLVYISEISNTFVKEVSDFLTVGQEVTVKIIGIDDNGRINLSIKQALPPEPAPQRPRPQRPANRDQQRPENRTPDRSQSYEQVLFGDDAPVDSEFEDKLKRFMKDSDSRLSDIKKQGERRTTKRRR